MDKKVLYKIKREDHSEEKIKNLLNDNKQIKFVSLMGVDLNGNGTEEKIPIKSFFDNIDNFLNGTAAQTDGSSVALPGIASLDDAKIDMIVDKDADWFVDYNENLFDDETGNRIGTLIIPVFLRHNGRLVDSRSILKSAEETFKKEVLKLVKDNPNNIVGVDVKDIDDIDLDTATELEFWVKTPNYKAEIEALTTSEHLQEQYWSKLNGPVRTAMEETLMAMGDYGFDPEMGHKEVGGITSTLSSNGGYDHVMEQLEIDWKYSNPMQTADNGLFIKNLVQEKFLMHGLETTFLPKPIDDVAGCGMHLHFSVHALMKDGKKKNIFNGNKDQFMGVVGYGALMGLLNNYEVVNPFISATHNALKRLQPGFEAPVCIVTSLGKTVEIPSRNRTILVALIRDTNNPNATRFELRSPNPKTNIYLATAATYMAMLDGIKYALENNKTENDLLKEISKNSGEYFGYLQKERQYRSEEDVFVHFNEKERSELFGNAPKSVFENISNLDKETEKIKILKENDVFTDELINSYKLSVMNRWKAELAKRIIEEYTNDIRDFKPLHKEERDLDIDISAWSSINNIRTYIAKDSTHFKCLFTRIREAIQEDDYKLASELAIEVEDKMEELRKLYSNYKKNVLDY